MSEKFGTLRLRDKYLFFQLASQLCQAAGTDKKKRELAEKVNFEENPQTIDRQQQISANAKETAIFLNNDIGADEDTKCLYLRSICLEFKDEIFNTLLTVVTTPTLAQPCPDKPLVRAKQRLDVRRGANQHQEDGTQSDQRY